MGWANKLIGWTSGNGAEVSTENALRVVDTGPSGNHFSIASKTGTIAAAAAAGACVFAMRVNPGYGGKVYIDSIKLRWTTIVAFTTPITQTRSLVITRGSGAAASLGTSLATAVKKDTAYGASQTDTALGGDTRIASTGALTVTGITFESVNLAEITLAHVGNAGNFYEHVYEFALRNHNVELNAGELLAIRVGSAAMDAGGTWSLGVEIGHRESLNEA